MVSTEETLSLSIVIDQVIPTGEQRGQGNSVIRTPNEI